MASCPRRPPVTFMFTARRTSDLTWSSALGSDCSELCWAILPLNVFRMWQWPHPHQQHQRVGAVLFIWTQTVTGRQFLVSCWAVGQRLRPLPIATPRPQTPALPTLIRPVTQTPCLGTYPTPKYNTNNFNNRVYTTLVGRSICGPSLGHVIRRRPQTVACI